MYKTHNFTPYILTQPIATSPVIAVTPFSVTGNAAKVVGQWIYGLVGYFREYPPDLGVAT